jgi:hypothetical protein
VISPEAEATADTPAEQVVSLMGTGEFDRLIGALRNAFPDLRDEAEDAIFEAVAKLLRRSNERRIEHVSAWIYKVATNHLIRTHHQRARRTDAEPELDEKQDPAEIAHGRETLALVKRIIVTWENAHIRVVTLLYVEAAWLGEPMSLLEARDLATSILGEELSLGSIGTWKDRGFNRLTAELTRMDLGIRGTRSR